MPPRPPSAPPRAAVPAQSYDFSWTGACAGTGSTVFVNVSPDVASDLHLSPSHLPASEGRG